MNVATHADRSAFDLLVALLRARLETAPAPAARAVESSDWHRLEHIAEIHGLAPFLESLLAPFGDGVPADVRERFQLHAVGNRMRNRIVGALIEEIDAGFAAAGCPLLLLKGASLLQSLYGEAGPRRLSDIDVLVREDALEIAQRALGEIGFAPVATREEHFFRRSMHTIFQRPQVRSIPVELHWDLAEPYRPYAFDLDAIWSAARPLGTEGHEIRAMSREHEVAHLCVHLERHALVYRHILERADWSEIVARGGAGTRLLWLYDVALCLQGWGSALDWDELVECSNRWGIAPNVRAALEICRRVFLIEPPANVLSRLHAGRRGIIESIACRALAAAPSADPGHDAAASHTARNATLALNVSAFLTPSAAYLRRRYGSGAPLPLLRLRHFTSAAGATAKAFVSILHRDGAGWTSARSGAPSTPSDGAAEATAPDEGTRLRASPHLMAEPIGTWLAVYDPERDASHRLNASAARILALCDGSRTVGEVAAGIRGDLGAECSGTDVASVIDVLRQHGLVAEETDWSWQPFNGQILRLRMVDEILDRFDCQAVIETGTFMGSTTAYLARRKACPVFSIEKDPHNYDRARRQLQAETNVLVLLGDSRTVLRALAEDGSVPKQGVFFYLDAHDFSDAPLRDELLVIAEKWRDSLIVIDDFEVPSDWGYGFDQWANGDRLALDRIPPLDELGFVPFFPARPSHEESGPRRGCVVLAPASLAEMVASIPSLRPCRAERQIPLERFDDYSMHGAVIVTYRYRDDVPAPNQVLTYSPQRVDECVASIRRGQTFYYEETDRWLYQALARHGIDGMKVAVMGSGNPVYESVCLAFGAAPTTIEHNRIESDDPRLTLLTPAEYDRDPTIFDAGLSISSFEHEGLGRYGDALNPSGDVEAMQRMKRMIVPGGRLFLAVPVGTDELVWNLHRVYGRVRLPLLLRGWRTVDTFGFDERSFDRRWTDTPQPVFVLENA